MPMNLTSAAQIVDHVLGGSLPWQWTVEAIVGDAWQTFLDHHDWRWAAGSRATITLVADQARYALPTDLGSILIVSSPEQRIEPVRLVAWRQLEEMRATGTVGVQGAPPYLGAVLWARTTDGTWRPELELWPVPGAAETMEVSYLPGSGPPQGNTDDLVLGYPPFIQGAWTQWLRAYALGLVEHDVASLEMRLSEVANGLVMRAAIKRDAGAVRRMPANPGAAMERSFRTFRRFHGTQ